MFVSNSKVDLKLQGENFLFSIVFVFHEIVAWSTRLFLHRVQPYLYHPFLVHYQSTIFHDSRWSLLKTEINHYPTLLLTTTQFRKMYKIWRRVQIVIIVFYVITRELVPSLNFASYVLKSCLILLDVINEAAKWTNFVRYNVKAYRPWQYPTRISLQCSPPFPPHPFPTLHPPHLYSFFVPVIFFIQFPLLITGTILTLLSGGVHFMLLFYSQDSCVCQKQ